MISTISGSDQTPAILVSQCFQLKLILMRQCDPAIPTSVPTRLAGRLKGSITLI